MENIYFSFFEIYEKEIHEERKFSIHGKNYFTRIVFYIFTYLLGSGPEGSFVQQVGPPYETKDEPTRTVLRYRTCKL